MRGGCEDEPLMNIVKLSVWRRIGGDLIKTVLLWGNPARHARVRDFWAENTENQAGVRDFSAENAENDARVGDFWLENAENDARV